MNFLEEVSSLSSKIAMQVGLQYEQDILHDPIKTSGDFHITSGLGRLIKKPSRYI